MFTLNTLRPFGPPLPEQGEGEGEGEGSSATAECGEYGNPSPRSSPLQGERREQQRRLWRVSQLARSTWIGALLLTANWAVTAANVLPIYIEDNHAGTFYWLAQNVDLDQSYTLILFDAHSDASGIFDSDKIRHALRNVASNEARQELLARWRSKGTVQCFNWIEPLMPAPIEKVIWVPAEKLSASQISEHRQKATALLDGHLEAAPRKSGSLREEYVVSDFEHLEKQIDPKQQLIVTIDLDYFAGLPAPEQEQAFARIWNFVIERPNLCAITFAISRPYLKSDEEAHRLLKLALTSALLLPTAQIEFEPFFTVPNDHSNLAKELMVKGEKLPAFELAQAPPELRARILSESKRITVLHDAAPWQQLLRVWNDEAPQLRLEVKDRQPSTDNVWRIPANEPAEIELLTEPWTTKPAKIEWFALTQKYSRCNVTDLSRDRSALSQMQRHVLHGMKLQLTITIPFCR